MVGAFALMGASYFLVRFNFKRCRPDQAPEGSPTTIIEGGRIRQDGLAKELLTESESPNVAAPAKGLSSYEEIESRELKVARRILSTTSGISPADLIISFYKVCAAVTERSVFDKIANRTCDRSNSTQRPRCSPLRSPSPY